MFTKSLVLGALLVGLTLAVSGQSVFAVLPPDGDPIQKIYVDNVKGNDKNDGSSKYPLKTVDWAFRVMNGSYAPSIEMYIRGTGVPYETVGSINFKRSNVLVRNWGQRPLIQGVVPTGAWHLADMALDSQSGVTVQNLDFLDVLFDGYTTPSISGLAEDITLSNLTFKIHRADILGEDPIVWFHQQGDTSYSQRSIRNLKIDRIKVGVDESALTNDGTDAIRIENVANASITRNIFHGLSWDSGVNVINSQDVKLANNRVPDADRAKVKLSLYEFDETDNSKVYNIF